MTAPPAPASPCIRVRLDYTNTDTFLGGNRLYFSYSGGAPSGANCTTLAGDIAAAWATDIAQQVHSTWTLTEVDVLDIATDTGLSGHWSGTEAGTADGSQLPAQVASNIEFNIARRYRGGKPRVYLPPPGENALLDPATWLADFVTSQNTQWGLFITAIEALDIGSMGTLAHVNLSYYKGFTNITNSSGRTRAAPTYRDSALVDTISGYSAKAEISSQRRRRMATSY